MIITENKIEADEGFVLQRISDEKLFGKVLYLGTTYWMYGKLIPKGIQELPSHYTEVPEEEINEGYDFINDINE